MSNPQPDWATVEPWRADIANALLSLLPEPKSHEVARTIVPIVERTLRALLAERETPCPACKAAVRFYRTGRVHRDGCPNQEAP